MRIVLVVGLLAYSFSRASEPDALALSASIRARHMPFGTLLDPIYAAPASNQIVAYTRCGDSALWTGAYLAAESFHYNVTRSAAALQNVKAALAGLTALADVTGDNHLARCMVSADWRFAAGIAAEETAHSVHSNPPWIWVGNTSRDQLIGAFFGLNIAFDLVDDPTVRSGARDLVTRLIGFVSQHQWSPNDDLSNTFLVRPEELQMLLQVARHVDPASRVSGPLLVLPVGVGIDYDVLSNSSYFKFNLAYMSLYHLLRLQDNDANRGAYQTLRSYTAGHQNPLFNLIDRALRGPDAARDGETASLVEQWLARPRRDFFVDLSGKVAVCGDQACRPVPIPLRPPATFLWEVTPFQLQGGGSGIVENAGVDYILGYWMARYYGVLEGSGVQSAAAAGIGAAPGSLVSLYGANLASAPATAASLPLPTTLGGITLTITDSGGAQRAAPLLYVSPDQINFLLPDNIAAGAASFAVSGTTPPKTASTAIQPVAPALFSMNGAGTGVAAALAVAIQPGSPATQISVPVFQCGSQGCAAVPISPGIDRTIYLSLYGTGIRHRTSLANVSVEMNGTAVAPQYAGPAPGFEGLDQVNVPLPLSLRGTGQVNVWVTLDGQTSNQVTIEVR